MSWTLPAVTMAQYRGVVKSFNETKGYGFIESADTAAIYGKDVFVLKTALQGAFPGDQVTFSVVDSNKGPQAENILVLNRRPMAAAARPGPYGQTVGPRPMGGPQLRGPVPARAPMNGKGGGGGVGGAPADNIGIVKSFNALKGWGFITSDEIMQTFGKDLFFMKSSLLAPVSEGQQVYFSIFESPKGTQAQNIQPATSNRMPAAFRSQTPVPAPSAYRPAMPVRQMHAAPMHAAPMHAAPMAAMHAYSPMPSTQPVHNEYFFGAVKGYNEEKGWGHITCQVAKDRFGKEVFLLRSALNGQTVEPGTLVGFTVNMSPKGPQANEVVVLPSDTFSFEGQPGRRYAASVKLFHQDKGWGFVTSEEITGLFFGKDIFLHNKQLNDSSVIPHAGDEAHFSIEIAENGKLQAREVDVFPAGHEEENFEPVRRPAMTMRSAPY